MMRLIDADKLLGVIAEQEMWNVPDFVYESIKNAPTIEAEPVIRCKDCKWFDKKEDSSYGYCHAMKHGHYSRHWEISIYRTYKEDFYCADGEKMDEVNDELV